MKRSRQSGLSLIELLITLAVLSILSVLAAPNIQALLQNNRLRAVTDEFTASLYQTRSEAVKRNNRVTMCASNTAQTGCDSSADNFSGGWIIFTDYDGGQVLDHQSRLFDTTGDGVSDTPEQIVFVSGVQKGNIEIEANVSTHKRVLTYRSNGLLDGNSSFSFILSDKQAGTQLSRIYVSFTGRVRQCFGDTSRCP